MAEQVAFEETQVHRDVTQTVDKQAIVAVTFDEQHRSKLTMPCERAQHVPQIRSLRADEREDGALLNLTIADHDTANQPAPNVAQS